MGELINLNAKVPLTDADIPSLIARDAETAAVVAAHAAATDPHPIYLTPTEADRAYPKFSRAIITGNCPSSQNGMILIPHGLTASKIRAFSAFVTAYGGTVSEIRIQPGGAVAPWIGTAFYYSVDVGPANVSVRTSTTANSAAIFGLPVTIVIDHI